MLKNLISGALPFIKVIFLAAIGQGVLIWLETSWGIDLPKMVASLLNQATNPTTIEAMAWLIVGLFGIGLTVLWERHKRPKIEKNVDTELAKPQRLQHKQDQLDRGLRGPQASAQAAPLVEIDAKGENYVRFELGKYDSQNFKITIEDFVPQHITSHRLENSNQTQTPPKYSLFVLDKPVKI